MEKVPSPWKKLPQSFPQNWIEIIARRKLPDLSVRNFKGNYTPSTVNAVLSVAVLRNLSSSHQLHYEIRPATIGGARVERLSFGFKTDDDRLRIHSELDDFQGDFAVGIEGLRGFQPSVPAGLWPA
jgi:hypothetical protein